MLVFLPLQTTGHFCDPSQEQLKSFNDNGYWREYVARQGGPILEKKQNWPGVEEEACQRWRSAMEQVFE